MRNRAHWEIQQDTSPNKHNTICAKIIQDLGVAAMPKTVLLTTELMSDLDIEMTIMKYGLEYDAVETVNAPFSKENIDSQMNLLRTKLAGGIVITLDKDAEETARKLGVSYVMGNKTQRLSKANRTKKKD